MVRNFTSKSKLTFTALLHRWSKSYKHSNLERSIELSCAFSSAKSALYSLAVSTNVLPLRVYNQGKHG